MITEFATELEDGTTTTGGPTSVDMANAITVWLTCNIDARNEGWEYPAPLNMPTLQEVALSFAVPVELIKLAVEESPWHFITIDKQGREVIEMEGL